MSSTTLSVAIDKKIRRLCLTDFPCGLGPWRQTKNGPDEARTESPDVLLDLLRYPRSPWMYNDTWSPQASDLRELAVREPKRLSKDFILNYFTTIRITGKNVSFIDEGLLKFSKLEELVLSGNLISEIPAKHLPGTLKILELRANRLSSLSGLASCPPPQLQYLGLGSNSLGSHQDVCDLTGRHWPCLACLDLSNCNFQEQRLLVATLETLPCLKTLTLKGNPFTMTPSYPGFTVDSLPQLSCLDSSWLTTEERYNFFGLARINDLVEDVASVTLSLTRLRGIPDPLMHVDKKAVEFPIVTYKYFVSYQFFSRHTPDHQGEDGNLDTSSRVTEDNSVRPDPGSDRNTGKSVSALDTADVPAVDAYETEQLSLYATPKLSWSECADLNYTLAYRISCLGDLKKFFTHGLHLNLMEEKTLSWPAPSEEAQHVKPSPTKDKKGKSKEKVKTPPKAKNKKKKGPPELVHDPPIRKLLNSVHIPMQSLVQGGQRVSSVCDFGPLHVEPPPKQEEETEKKPKGDKKDKTKDCKEAKEKQKKHTEPQKSPKGKGKDAKKRDMDEHTVPPVPVPPVPVTVELSVELEKWKSVSDAFHSVTPVENG
ncbi:leucine-rich repeat-containing protein 43 isoform X1 [Poecilia latipinna]|uniref:leucine-rich repeat-containing protein 43 isoform X1 n=1 Tax=Poecilia latipinna TaxID=48699 RepID=UPI00072E82AA|nr:PREDICTED: leucine-rich repeat-containing protein 43 isoform X1 [Poecilia latipinna]